MTEEKIEIESEQDSQATEESTIEISEMEVESPKPEFVPPPKGFLYSDVDENHKLIIQNQYEAQLKELPLVEFEQAYNGDLYEKGFVPLEPVEYQNEAIRFQRQARYVVEADPLRLDWDESAARGEEQAEEKKQIWLAKKDEIRKDLPYIEEAV